jgi:hypothetical protein
VREATLIPRTKEHLMPVIKPRTRGKQLVRHITRLDRENNETLYAYAQFLGEPTDYVINQLIDSVLGKDKDFVAWRAEHRDSYVPAPAARKTGGKRTHSSNSHSVQSAHRHPSVSAPAAG